MSKILTHIQDYNAIKNREYYLDENTIMHCDTTASICSKLSLNLDIPYCDKRILILAAKLHDIGKHFVPKEILNAERKLTDEERVLVDLHSALGYLELRKLGCSEDICDLVLLHHGLEKINGIRSLSAISERALSLYQILMASDIYSAVTVDRPYHKASTHEEAIEIVSEKKEIDRGIIIALKDLNNSDKDNVLFM